MPTFHVYSGGQRAEEIVGGNLNALKAACEKYGKASQSFQGTGHTLSGQYVVIAVVAHHAVNCVSAWTHGSGVIP